MKEHENTPRKSAGVIRVLRPRLRAWASGREVDPLQPEDDSQAGGSRFPQVEKLKLANPNLNYSN